MRTIILASIFLLLVLSVVGLLVLQHSTAGSNKALNITSTPSTDESGYNNAAYITQEQKDEAMKIVSTSDVYKEYMKYPHGTYNFIWAYPYTGKIYLSTVINPNSTNSNVYGLLSFNVDIKNSTVAYAGFTDWHKYW